MLESQGNKLSPKAPEGTIALPHLNFSPLRPPELQSKWENKEAEPI